MGEPNRLSEATRMSHQMEFNTREPTTSPVEQGEDAASEQPAAEPDEAPGT